jgi:predicted Fe-Mo cluster-binding NifX family protein
MWVAIPIRSKRISPVFDSAGQILLVELDDGQERSRCVAPLPGECLSARANRLGELGVAVLICGGISRTLQQMIEAGGIRVYPWTAGPVDEVLEAYRQGRLHEAQWLMPGCGDPGRGANAGEGCHGGTPVRPGRPAKGRKEKPDTSR